MRATHGHLPGLTPNQTLHNGVVEHDGKVIRFDAWTGQSVLASMEAGGIDWPSACRNGTCRTCLAQVVSGHIQHTVAWPGLSSDELAEGCALPCVANPLSNLHLRRTT
ncbi:MAG: 2Fe-2S iron-sulfur cluster binding domain-containing protein [Burkholderiales bacterium]|nr:2Fe-2S iron-sulfur cluster binding domain-containing protein [Burkholderiales bacterium]